MGPTSRTRTLVQGTRDQAHCRWRTRVQTQTDPNFSSAPRKPRSWTGSTLSLDPLYLEWTRFGLWKHLDPHLGSPPRGLSSKTVESAEAYCGFLFLRLK